VCSSDLLRLNLTVLHLLPHGGKTGGLIGLNIASVSLLRRFKPGEDTGEARWDLDLSGGGGGLGGT
jgi:hypothetical protein